MSTIQFGGVISGLNTQGIIDALVAVKKQPLTELQSKEADLTSQKAAYSQVGTALDDLVTKVKLFTVTAAGASRVATSADPTVFTATAATSTPVSQYQVSVDRLATATRAASTTSMGAAVTGNVDTSLKLSNANLATPITTGNMTLTVDGTAVQFAVGDPTTTSLQTVMDGLAGALQSQLQMSDAGSTVSAAIVGGQLQLSISGNATGHDISFGDIGDTSNAAKALGLDTQGVSGAQNAAITGTSYLDPVLSSLNLPGSVTAGQITAVVDGILVHYTVGDPTKTTLTQTLVIANAKATNATNPTLTGTTNLGVARMNGSLDTAGLTGLTSTKTGVLTINGVDIAYDTTGDSMSALITRINNSAAGVVASVDRTNDQLILARKDTGAVAMDIKDTSGTLGAALKLAPGTTNAQTIGLTAQVTVDGRSITSTTNAVSNAIDGVTINFAKLSPLGLAQTLTIGVDQTAVSNALSPSWTKTQSQPP